MKEIYKKLLLIIKINYKIFLHIIALTLFLLGIVILHIVHNYNYLIYKPLDFFGIPININILFDIGLILIGIGFFIEFFLTFKPIKIIDD